MDLPVERHLPPATPFGGDPGKSFEIPARKYREILGNPWRSREIQGIPRKFRKSQNLKKSMKINKNL
jgi:hypothetical protein